MIDHEILFVEDDQAILDSLSLALEKNGFSVLKATSGEDALDIVSFKTPNLILLDLNLPGMNGGEFAAKCKEISHLKNVPIVIITGVDFEDVIVRALEDYADDYINKPVRARVLTARLHAVLRRYGHNAGDRKGSPLVIKTQTYEVLLDGEPIHLTRSEYSILKFLYQHPNKPFSRELIIKQIRGNDYHVERRSLDYQIFGIRKKLGEYAHLIETVRGVGFRYKADE